MAELPFPFPETEWYSNHVREKIPTAMGDYPELYVIDETKSKPENLARFLDDVAVLTTKEDERYEKFTLYLVTLFEQENDFNKNLDECFRIVEEKAVIPQIKTVNQLRKAYEDGGEYYQNSLETDMAINELLQEDKKLFGVPKFTVERQKVDSVSIEVDIKAPDEVKDLISFFDTFICSEGFPALWIAPDKENRVRGHLKVYTNSAPDLKFTDRNRASNILYLLIRFGERKNLVGEIFIENEGDAKMFKMQVTLDDGSRFNEMKEVLSKFPKPFSIPDLGASKAFYTYSLKFIEGSVIDLESFVTAVTLNGNLARYLSLREASNPPSSKSIRLQYHFPFPHPNSQPVNFLLQGNLINKKEGSDYTPSISSVISTMSIDDSEDDGSVIDIRLQGEREEDAVKFIPSIAALLRYYLAELRYDFGYLLRQYCDIIIQSNVEKTEVSIRKEKSILRAKSSRSSSISSARTVREIRSVNLFDYFEPLDSKVVEERIKKAVLDTDYRKVSLSNICPLSVQPQILKPNKVNEWNKLQFIWSGKVYNRFALPYPTPDNPQFYLGSPSPTQPFIGLKLHDQKLFPCCFDEDQNVPGKKLYKYLHGQNVETVVQVTSKGNIVQNISIQEAGKISLIPVDLEVFLKSFNSTGEYRKMGVPIGLNSILHCCYLATSRGYRNRFKINLPVSEKRISLDNYIFTSVQNYLEETSVLNLIRDTVKDRTDEDLIDILLSTDKYVDPKIFSKMLEFMFKCRLLLFTVDKNKIDYIEPNYYVAPSGFPAKLTNSDDVKQTIICLGQKNENHYQWELIFFEQNGEKQYVFSESLGLELAKFIISSFRTNQIVFEGKYMKKYDPVGFNASFFVDEITRSTDYMLVAQYLDSLGKCRALKFYADVSEHTFVVQITPSRPFEVDLMDEIEINEDLSGYEVIMSVFGEPRRYFRDERIWKVTWDDGTDNNYVAFQFNPEKVPAILDELANDPTVKVVDKPIEYYSTSATKIYIELHKTARRFEKVIILLFVHFLIELDQKIIHDFRPLIDEFAAYWEIDPDIHYDFQSLRGSFPTNKSFVELLSYLEKTNLTRDGRIVFDSQELVNKIDLILLRWLSNRTYADVVDYVLDKIPGFYDYATDFEKQQGVRIYVGEKNPVILYRSEYKNLQPPTVIRGPYQYVSYVYPCHSADEARNRAQLWRMDKNNNNLANDNRLLGKPKTKILHWEDVENSINDKEDEEQIYILEEGETTRPKKYSVLLPFGTY